MGEHLNEEFTKYLPEHIIPSNMSDVLLKKVQDIQANFLRSPFITRSSYSGIWQDSLQCMDGYGVYTFPDGSEYRGYFKRGNFNGYGTLHLAAPYDFTYKGIFIDGQLEEVDDMSFDDGLHVEASLKSMTHLDFSKWKYCCKLDRRFAAEQRDGINPVGPTSYLTARRHATELAEGMYDVEEGVFNSSNQMAVKRQPPLAASQFVSCKSSVERIIKHCRRSSLDFNDITDEYLSKILDINLHSHGKGGEAVSCCNYDLKEERQRYFGNICRQKVLGGTLNTVKEGNEGNTSNQSISDCVGLNDHSSISNSSCSDNSLIVDVDEQLILSKGYDEMIAGKDLEEQSPDFPPKQIKNVL